MIVGIASSQAVLSERPWFWTPSTGMVDLVNVLGTQLPAGWRLREVFGVSADGYTIVGRGLDPLNKNQGWVVTIPAPSVLTALPFLLSYSNAGPAPVRSQPDAL
jgi:hypothetical protein